MFQSRDILISGSLGWLGIRLIKGLIEGLPDAPGFATPDQTLRIRCLIQPGQDPRDLLALSDNIQAFEGDLRDPASLIPFFDRTQDAVLLHTAGIIHPKRTQEFYDINVQGTENLLSAAVKAGVQRGVVISSNSPCGCNPHVDHLFDEESPYHPYLGYGRSKMQMEQRVSAFYDRGDLDVVIIRPPWFYGPDQSPRQTLFFKMICDGKAPIIGGGYNLRSMVYIDNLCLGVFLAVKTPEAAGRIYWIADARPYTMNEIIDTIEKLFENEFGQICAHKRLRLPGISSEIAFWMDSGLQKVGLYNQKIHVLSEMNKTIACSITKAQTELGYAPSVSLEEGMRRSILWCMDHGYL